MNRPINPEKHGNTSSTPEIQRRDLLIICLVLQNRVLAMLEKDDPMETRRVNVSRWRLLN
jgi:hypothetical protein